MQHDLKDLTVAELRTKLERMQLSVEFGIVEACTIVVELRRRGQTSMDLRQGIYQWAQQIVDGKLHPRVAFTFSESYVHTHAFIGLPLEKQENLIKGQTVTVAEVLSDGTIKAVEKTVFDMAQTVFTRVFDAGSIRTFNQQKKLLTSRYESRRTHRVAVPTAIRVDKTTEEVVIGQFRLSASELAVALGELGFKVTRRIRVAAVTVETPVQRAA